MLHGANRGPAAAAAAAVAVAATALGRLAATAALCHQSELQLQQPREEHCLQKY